MYFKYSKVLNCFFKQYKVIYFVKVLEPDKL